MRRILFIDVQNSIRSPMAAAWFNSMSPYGYRALSCGTIPAPQVDPLAVQAMHVAGLDIAAHSPNRITCQLLASADVAVLIGSDLGTRLLTPTQVWSLRDPVNPSLDAYLALSNVIRSHVRQLILDLRLMPFAKKQAAPVGYSPGYQSRM